MTVKFDVPPAVNMKLSAMGLLLAMMLSPDNIKHLCLRKYPEFLRSIVKGEAFFPLEIRFGKPSVSDEWSTLQQEITSLVQGKLGYRIDWTETNTRRWGRQRLPERVWFENEAAFVNAICKHAEVKDFRQNLLLTRNACPELEDWLVPNVTSLMDFSNVWSELLKVCRYFLATPHPGLYIRELPVSVGTKFIERHEGILRKLLDFLLPASAKTESDRFEERYGLRFDEPLIRFRMLDVKLQSCFGVPVDDLSVPLRQFCHLNWSGITVLIVENKMTLLTLPCVENSLAIFGGGGAASLLTKVKWLMQCRLIYWGDIDVHGFHILSRLRKTFPGITSLMMDGQTLEQFLPSAVSAKPSSYEDYKYLSESETSVYELVRDSCLLLEQERISCEYARQKLHQILNGQTSDQRE